VKILNNIPNWLQISLKIILSISALALVIYKVDFNQVTQIVVASKWWFLIPAVVFFAISKIISSVRLNSFFKILDISLTEKDNLKLYWLGMFYNLFLPGGISGDGYKIFLLNKKFNTGAKKIFNAVFLDRIYGLIALSLLSALLAIFLPIESKIIWMVWVLMVIGFFLFYRFIKKYFNTFIGNFKNSIILSLFVQLFQLISVMFIIEALQIAEYKEMYLFIFLISSVVATIPFTIGGFGARELTFLYVTTFLSIDSEPAIGLSFLFFLISTSVSFYGIRYNIDAHFEKKLGT
jgi:uncharacterized membrane protein YbhN (UPF0104 family)